MLSQPLEVFKLSRGVFSEEKASLEQKTTGGIYCLCSQTLQNTLASKSAFLIKLVEFLRQIFKADSSNCHGMGRRDISQHIPVPRNCLGEIPLPSAK